MTASLKTYGLNRVAKTIKNHIKQARFAAAVAMSRTAYIAAQDAKDQAKKDIDNPTPWTLRGFRYRKANKRTLEASVYIAQSQSKYLRWMVEGGRRKGRSKLGEALPVEIKLNRYGNIPGRHKGKVKTLMARKDTFLREHKGTTGLFQRTGGKRNPGLKLLLVFVPYVIYKSKFAFYEATRQSFAKNYGPQFDKAYKKALATAR